MNILFYEYFILFVFVVNLQIITGQISKHFCALQNVGVLPSVIPYKALKTQGLVDCVWFCLLDKACMGSVFTGDSCHLLSQSPVASQLQHVTGHKTLTPNPIYRGKSS